MTVKTTILEIAHGALGASYLDAIKAMYQQAVEDGVFETVEMVHSAAPNGSWCGDQRQLSAANGTLN